MAYPVWYRGLVTFEECRNLPAVRQALDSLDSAHRLASSVLARWACRLKLNGGLIEVAGEHCRRILPAERECFDGPLIWPQGLNKLGSIPAEDYRHIKEADVILKQMRHELAITLEDESEIIAKLFEGPPVSGASSKTGRQKRGRRKPGPKGPQYDVKEDKRIYDGWKASDERSIDAYARKKQGATTAGEIRRIRLAIDREKKRRKRKGLK